jgi:endonuclease/exonuclease/phosphatase family metal-dependent hydrolase
MRIVGFNILDGGVGRADPLAEVIEAQRPDIVALVEADDDAVVERIAKRLKMEYLRVDGKKHGAAILVRGNIIESINHSVLRIVLSDCLLEATVSVGGQEWTVAAVHLHPHAKVEDEKVREREIDAILEIFAGHRKANRPHVLAGDFNANSPIQAIEIEKCKERTKDDFAANGGMLPRTAIHKLLDAGYVDTFYAHDPWKAAKTGSFSTQFPGQRVDFIFTFGVDISKIKEAGIERDRLAKYASDHFPTRVEILGAETL